MGLKMQCPSNPLVNHHITLWLSTCKLGYTRIPQHFQTNPYRDQFVPTKVGWDLARLPQQYWLEAKGYKAIGYHINIYEDVDWCKLEKLASMQMQEFAPYWSPLIAIAMRLRHSCARSLRPGTTDVTNCPSRARIQHSYCHTGFIKSGFQWHWCRVLSMANLQMSCHQQSHSIIFSSYSYYTTYNDI